MYINLDMRIFLFLMLLNSISISSQTLINLREELSPAVFAEWDNYIKDYAPSDSAFNVVSNLVRRHYSAQRSAVAMLVIDMYAPLFPQKDSILKESRKIHEQLMLSQTPNPDMLGLYSKYVRLKAPNRDAIFALQRITDSYIIRKDWDSAAFIFDYYKQYFPENQDYFNDVIKILSAPEEGLVINNLGDSINTNLAEWDPNPTPDGRFLYFTSAHRRGGFGNADIWVSELVNGKWSKAQNIGNAINGSRNETIDNVTTDGTGLFLSGDFPGTFGQFDIFYASKTDSSWESLLHYPMPINTEYADESGSLTSDGKVLIFTSDRPGGIGDYKPYMTYHGGSEMGNIDIYVSILQNGEWSDAINLGTTINTPFAERSAFLHPDGKTLYFSSNGHPGLGRLDVFKSIRLKEDSWTEWSKPVNLGKEINSADDDWGYKISFKGDSAFFAAKNRQSGFGDWDLYSVTLPEIAKPEKVIAVRGKVLDSKGYHVSAKIIWEDLETGEIIGELKSDPRDGSYFIALPYGRNYGYYASRYGYYPESNNINLKDDNINDDIYHNIKMISLQDLNKADVKIRINNLFFDFGKSKLKPESYPELNRLTEFLKQNKKYLVIIEGHTDNIGTKETNKTLSEERAKAVANYLVSKGFDINSFVIEGFGDAKPIVDNNSEKNRALNRRVEISFRKK